MKNETARKRSQKAKPRKAKPKAAPASKRTRGRPSDYKPEYAKQAYKLTAFMGAIDEDLAKFFDKTPSTIALWKTKHSDFSEAIKRGKIETDMKVVERLYERAIGYSHPEDKIFLYKGRKVVAKTIKHYPPDPLSAIFWLKNRQSEKWRSKPEPLGDDSSTPDGFEVIEYDDPA